MELDAKTRAELNWIRAQAESDLAKNLMPFWARNAWDAEYGGFLTRLDRAGGRLDDSEKILMMQVRMIHSLSAAHRHGLQDRGYLEMAGITFDYVLRHMWDENNGGFFYSATRDGTPKCLRKNTDFHGYAMTGFSEYAVASGRRDALDWAARIWDVLRTQAADRDKGYIEDFDGGDWDALNSGQMNLGHQRKIKTIDMHTNVLEGLMYLAKAEQALYGRPSTRHLSALSHLLDLICARGIHPDHPCTVTVFDCDWNPVPDAQGAMTTSYGINVELAWLLLEAVDVLREPRDQYRGVVLGLVDHALAYGFDHERGGLAAYGPLTGRVDDDVALPDNRLLKSWWAQAEMMNALVDAWLWTRAPQYWKALVKLFDWVHHHQIDHEHGDWFQDTYWDSGRPVTTLKGNEFKTSFHAGRALIRTADALRTAGS